MTPEKDFTYNVLGNILILTQKMMKDLVKNWRNWLVPSTGIAVTLLFVALHVYPPGWIRSLDSKLYDVAMQRGHSSEITGAVAIVDLDEKSLQQYGQWPWPRYRMALLLQKLREAGVKAVGLDILFAEPDRSSPYILQRDLKKDLDVDMEFSGLPQALHDNDRIFANILKDGPYSLGFFFDFETQSARTDVGYLKDLNPARKGDNTVRPETFLIRAPAVLPPLDILCESVPATGFVNSIVDDDGVLRSTPLVLLYNDRIYANLGLSVIWIALGREQCILKATDKGIESFRIGKAIIPLDKNGRVSVHFRGPRHTFPYYSASDILEGTVPAENLRDKIILIGSTAAGLYDMYATPLDSHFPGVEVNATLIDNILKGDLIAEPHWLSKWELRLTLAAGLLTTALVCWLSTWHILPVIVIFICAGWYASIWSFATHQFYFSPLFPILATGVNFSLLSFLKFLRTDIQKRFLRRAFSRYVSRSVVDRIVDSPELLALEGEEKEVSILFSDIRGFTNLSEQLTPSQVASLLNNYFTPITKIIVDHNGTLDKFIGDAVMAFWNAPVDIKNHREKAVATGLAMLDALQDMNVTFQKNFGLTVQVGIGLHAGHVSVGNMGSEDLFDYTIIGDNVNLTSRLEALTKFYGVTLIVSKAMADIDVAGYHVQELDTVKVKGKEKPVTLYTFRRQEEFILDELTKWMEALESYKNGEFAQALDQISLLTDYQPGFQLYVLYAERCRKFIAQKPLESWDGVYSHMNK